MDMRNLRDTHPTLITYMKEQGYNHEYITRLEREIDRILSNDDNSGWRSYADIYRSYTEATTSKQSLRYRLAILGIIERFDLRGEFPDGRTR